MKKEKFLSFIATLFAISWISLAVFGFLFIRERAKNTKLKKTIIAWEEKANYADEDTRRYEELRKEKDKWQEGALNYLEWQFVLKGQVEQSRQRVIKQLNKIKDPQKSKELQNLIYYNLGLSYTLTTDFASSINAFEEALRFDPKDAQSYYNLGLLYSTYGRNVKKAIRCYKKYLELISPSDVKSEEVKERIRGLEKK
jgi:tetratricopeptide (TPR) repeat protein